MHSRHRNQFLLPGQMVLVLKYSVNYPPETVNLKLQNLADIDDIGPERVMGGTDCGFETFAGLGSVTRNIALKKLESLAKGARLKE